MVGHRTILAMGAFGYLALTQKEMCFHAHKHEFISRMAIRHALDKKLPLVQRVRFYQAEAESDQL